MVLLAPTVMNMGSHTTLYIILIRQRTQDAHVYRTSMVGMSPLNFFAAGCKIMQHYVLHAIHHYATLYNPLRYIAAYSPPYVVNDHFCGGNCPKFNWHIILPNVA